MADVHTILEWCENNTHDIDKETRNIIIKKQYEIIKIIKINLQV